MTNEIFRMGAAELAEQIQYGRYSPTEVIEKTLERIHTRNDTINSFVTVCDEEAREAAKEVEDTLQNDNEVGPLAGVPVAIKDLINVSGVPTTYGSVPLTNNIPDQNDVLVDRLKNAGAIIVGKTNTPEFGRKTVTENLLVGPTRNPWDYSRIAGGSSGGSSAALADGQVPLTVGTDSGGSIRIPSAACGTVGMIPDFGRIPHGNSRSDAFVNTHPFGYAGPMARNVKDIALALDVMAGPHTTDPFSLPDNGTSYVELLEKDINNWTIAYSPDLGICDVSSEVRKQTKKATRSLENAGATIKHETPDFDFDYNRLHNVISILLQDRYLGLYESIKHDFGVDLLDSNTVVTKEVASRIKKAKKLDSGSVRRAERIRTAAYDTLQSFFSDYDLLAVPTIGRPPFELGNNAPEINGEQVNPNHGWVLTWPFNLTGNPTISVPAGTIDGLPIGLQLVGQQLSDSDIICAAAAYERENSWTGNYPY